MAEQTRVHSTYAGGEDLRYASEQDAESSKTGGCCASEIFKNQKPTVLRNIHCDVRALM